MLRHGLARHLEPLAELAECLAVSFLQPIEQQSATRVSQRFEDEIDVRAHAFIMQPYGCMSSGKRRGCNRSAGSVILPTRF